jgi:DNA-binding NtrC family response regulator
MAVPSILFLGDFSDERIVWDEAASHLAWTVHLVPDLASLERRSNGDEITAVFVDQRTQGTSDAIRLRRIRVLLPDARIILCCPLRSIFDIDPDELGVFHVIARPLKIEELRASIGFVWEAWFRRSTQNRAVAAA